MSTSINVANEPLVGITDWVINALESPGTAYEAYSTFLTWSDRLISLEASTLVLLGALAAIAGGRILLVLMGCAFILGLMQEFGLVVDTPTWVPEVFAITLAVGTLHLILALLLSEQTAGTLLAAIFVGLITLVLFRPLALLRIPRIAALFQQKGRK